MVDQPDKYVTEAEGRSVIHFEQSYKKWWEISYQKTIKLYKMYNTAYECIWMKVYLSDSALYYCAL